jgi:hypothetical protein
MGCEHEITKATRRKISNGTIIVSMQCQRCGSGKAAKMSNYKMADLPEFDDSIRERYQQEIQVRWNRERDQRMMEQLTKTGQWWSNYTTYLKSLDWQTTRRVVIDRDRVCQKCFIEAATQAHHLTYETYNKHGFTFPQECVALCYACHESLHPGCNE